MMWIDGVSPVDVFEAYAAAVVALVIFGIPASLQQQRYSPIIKDAKNRPPRGLGARGDRGRHFARRNHHERGNQPGVFRVFGPLPIHRRRRLGGDPCLRSLAQCPTGKLLPDAFKGSVFLLSLILCASMMPVEQLPAASWQTAFGLGFVSAVFDNIPLTALALKQGGYDWGYLAYAVGFGGSMIWFGSSAGVALANLFPEAKSVGQWLRHGWHVAVAYVIGFFVLLAFLGWHPNAPHKSKPVAKLQEMQASGHFTS